MAAFLSVLLSVIFIMGAMLLTLAFLFAVIATLPLPGNNRSRRHGPHSRKHPRR